MKKYLIAAAAVFLVSCNKQAQETIQIQNSEFKVDFLFENDGCKVYRFFDGGRAIYYTDCKGETTAIHTESAGKNSRREVTATDRKPFRIFSHPVQTQRPEPVRFLADANNRRTGTGSAGH